MSENILTRRKPTFTFPKPLLNVMKNGCFKYLSTLNTEAVGVEAKKEKRLHTSVFF